jgi:inosose dehydratase
MALTVRLSNVPILWNNDDVPELTQPPVPAERVLAEMAKAGFEGTELGSNYPAEPAALRAMLGRFGLKLSGGYFCDDYLDPARHAQIVAAAEKKARFLAECGAGYLVVADCIHPERSKVAGRARAEHGLKYPQFTAMVEVLQRIADVAQRASLQMVFHNHCGTYVETPEELDRLMSATDAKVGLCLDTGHYTFGGGNPVEAVSKYAKRLRYVHLKDVDPQAAELARADKVDFLEALRRRVFCEVGTGKLDLRGVLAALSKVGYAGWLVSEQDTTRKAPLESATLSRQNLMKVLAETK